MKVQADISYGSNFYIKVSTGDWKEGLEVTISAADRSFYAVDKTPNWEVSINWGGYGSRDVEFSRRFAEVQQMAVIVAAQLEDFLKENPKTNAYEAALSLPINNRDQVVVWQEQEAIQKEKDAEEQRIRAAERQARVDAGLCMESKAGKVCQNKGRFIVTYKAGTPGAEQFPDWSIRYCGHHIRIYDQDPKYSVTDSLDR